jgi:two-component system chemotaxis response regulator CheB
LPSFEDGLELAKEIMAYHPTPIFIVSAFNSKTDMDKAFNAISCGVLDVFNKGVEELINDRKSLEIFAEKIEILSGIKVLPHPLAKSERRKKNQPLTEQVPSQQMDKIVAIAASTGGPQALFEILKELPENFPCPLVIVQHIANSFDSKLASWLNENCQIKVKVATHLEKLCPGVAYLAPCNLHMQVGKNKIIKLLDTGSPMAHKPSADILFESVSQVYGKKTIAVILSGMGSDGARGIKAIKNMKGQTIAQDETSSLVFGMPKAAIELNAIDKILPLEEIGIKILRLINMDREKI